MSKIQPVLVAALIGLIGFLFSQYFDTFVTEAAFSEHVVGNVRLEAKVDQILVILQEIKEKLP